MHEENVMVYKIHTVPSSSSPSVTSGNIFLVHCNR